MKKMQIPAVLLLVCVVAAGVWAQTETKVLKGTVVYVSGNDLIVKGEKGMVKHFVVPESQKFTVDGKEVTVHDLKVGTALTAAITTTTTADTVVTVKTGSGKVWMVQPPTLIVELPNGTHKQVRVPEGQKFAVNGEEKTVFDLQKGMKISWTIVRAEPEQTISQKTKVTGHAPPPPPTPKEIGALLIEEGPISEPAPKEEPKTEPPPAKLPKTASNLPLVGLLGLLLVAASLGTGLLRRVA
jgi:hypothetical protein